MKIRNIYSASIVLLVIIIYYPLLGFDFIPYDDPLYVTINEKVLSGLTYENIIWAFVNIEASNWHPITWISYFIDVELFGVNPAGFHLHNLIVHVLNSIILYYLIYRISFDVGLAYFVAIVFAIHPAHIESVAWISERKDLLSTFFLFIAIYQFNKYKLFLKRKYYYYSLIAYMMGLMSKSMIVTLPFLLVLLEIWPMNIIKLNKNFHIAVLSSIKEKIPFFLLSLLSIVITLYAQKGAMSGLGDSLSLEQKLANVFVSYTHYVFMFFSPVNLAVFYPHPVNWPIEKTLASFFMITLITGYIVLNIKRQKDLFVGWFWFMGMLVPVIGIVQVGLQAMADRYTYVPYIGLSIVTYSLVKHTVRIINKKSIYFILIIYLLSLIILSKHYLGYWENGVKLFSRAISINDSGYSALINEGKIIERKLPSSIAFMYMLVGSELVKVGLVEEGLQHLKLSYQLNAKDYQTNKSLAVAYCENGNYEKTIYHYEIAVSLLRPDYRNYRFELERLALVKSDINEGCGSK